MDVNVSEAVASLQRQLDDLQRGQSPVPSTSTEYEKELKKWDTPRRLGGMRADGFEPYPLSLYRQTRNEGDGKKVMHHTVAKSPSHQQQLEAEGWLPDQHQAIARFTKLEDDISQAAAEAAASVRRMSPRAQQEYAAQEDAQADHVTDVPAPTRRPKLRVE